VFAGYPEAPYGADGYDESINAWERRVLDPVGWHALIGRCFAAALAVAAPALTTRALLPADHIAGRVAAVAGGAWTTACLAAGDHTRPLLSST
jgi:hypothetical protein